MFQTIGAKALSTSWQPCFDTLKKFDIEKSFVASLYRRLSVLAKSTIPRHTFLTHFRVPSIITKCGAGARSRLYCIYFYVHAYPACTAQYPTGSTALR